MAVVYAGLQEEKARRESDRRYVLYRFFVRGVSWARVWFCSIAEERLKREVFLFHRTELAVKKKHELLASDLVLYFWIFPLGRGYDLVT